MATRPKKKVKQARKEEFLGLLLIILGILVLLSFLSYEFTDYPNSSDRDSVNNWLGLVGAGLSFYAYNYTIGFPALVLPFLLIYLGWFVLKKDSLLIFGKRAGYILFFSFCFSVAFALPREFMQEDYLYDYEFNGHIGLFFAQKLQKYLGSIGSVLILFSVMILAFLSLTEVTVTGLLLRFADELKQVQNRLLAQWDRMYREYQLKKSLRDKQKSVKSETKYNKKEIIIDTPAVTSPEKSESKDNDLQFDLDVEADEASSEYEELNEQTSKINFDFLEKTEDPPELEDEKEDPDKEIPERIEVEEAPPDYCLPSIELLEEPVFVNGEQMKSHLLQEARTLEEKLGIYGIEAKVMQIHPGPLITQFEVEPAEGVKISKFFGIADDLAMVMRAQQVRILAPIPGKAVVGIEIPNKNPETISFRNIIDTDKFRSSKYKLPIALGVDTTGKVYLTDMVRMPHLLVAGSTGSGKSVCLNTIIASFLYRLSPENLRLILIDPKKLELSNYAELRNHHLITIPDMNEEVITTPENAITILGRVWQEMENRFTILAKANVRTLEDFNNKVSAGEFKEKHPDLIKLPYIVVIIDELADLLLASGQEVEEPIGRLANKARAVGIHLIVATQRPSTDVITGAIKANFPCRIAFKVFSKTDSRVVLDINGAEQLLGRGDMLFQPPGQPAPIRLHSPLISSEEISRIIESIADQPPFPEFKLPDIRSEAVIEMPDGRKVSAQRDSLFYEALKLVVRHQQGSISLLQRRLRIGYARAARIIDEMEQAGFVGTFDGSKARDVLITENDLDDMGVM